MKLLVLLAAVAFSSAMTTERTTPAEEEVPEPQWYVSGCRYYCVYDEVPYCCDDGTLEMPANHRRHEGECPPEDAHICKTSGIYLAPWTAEPWVKGAPKEQPMCASDGYCKSDQRCCPSPCVRRHLCMRALPSQEEEEGEERWQEEEEDQGREEKEKRIDDDEMEGEEIEREDAELV